MRATENDKIIIALFYKDSEVQNRKLESEALKRTRKSEDEVARAEFRMKRKIEIARNKRRQKGEL